MNSSSTQRSEIRGRTKVRGVQPVGSRSRRRSIDHRPSTIVYRAFTLVEMIVSTALVMLLMIIFAEVFSAAVGTITAQRGIGHNDQKARSFTTILRNDLGARTYGSAADRSTLVIFPGTAGALVPIQQAPRGIIPLAPGDAVDGDAQVGYIYLSENDTSDDTDDVLQLTADIARIRAITPELGATPYYGRALFLDGDDSSVMHPNQPDWDDGIDIDGDGASSSELAEIAYFVRGGNLYRRVMLIREPLPSPPPGFDAQPTQDPGGTGDPFHYPAGAANPPYFDQPFSDISSTFPSGSALSFYSYWDFSGTRVFVADDGNGTIDAEPQDTYGFRFNGAPSLDNTLGATNNPLGIPWRRFGFYSRAPFHRPVEYLFDSTPSPTAFIGRFTHEETSHDDFGWPGVEDVDADHPFRRTDLTLDANNTVSQYAGGDRAGEDILLTNVEAFDIEVWDPYYSESDTDGDGDFEEFDATEDLNLNGVWEPSGAWVELGNAYGSGIFGIGDRANTNYGPLYTAGSGTGTLANRVFDTWHTHVGIDDEGDGLIDADELQRPPYRPLQRRPTPATDYSSNPPLAQDSVYDWEPSTEYVEGQVFFPEALGADGAAGQLGVDEDGDGPPADVDGNGNPDPDEIEAIGSDDNLSYAYVVIQSGTSDPSAANEPNWSNDPGLIFDDGSVRWRCFDNRVGLEQIRITVRYRDVSTGQTRQVTLVHSMVD